MTDVMLLGHLHYYISASPSKLFALRLHAISHIPMLLLHCTCTQLDMNRQISQIDSCFAFTSQYFMGFYREKSLNCWDAVSAHHVSVPMPVAPLERQICSAINTALIQTLLCYTCAERCVSTTKVYCLLYLNTIVREIYISNLSVYIFTVIDLRNTAIVMFGCVSDTIAGE